MSTARVEPLDMFEDTCACLIAAAEQYRANISRGREAAEAALMAARRAGVILAGLQKSSGGRPNKHPQHSAAVSDYRKAIAAAQISERTAETWQQIAAVPDNVFTEYLTGEDDDGERILPSIRDLLLHTQFLSGDEDEQKEEPELKTRFRAWRKAKRPKARERQQQSARFVRSGEVSAEVWKAASRIIECGFRTLAKETHPDHQGDNREMQNLNLAVEQLREMVAAKVEGF